MKMIFTCCIAALLNLATAAQTNNPYNQAGADIVRSAQIIAGEIKQGNIRDVNEATIKKAVSMVPSKMQMDASLAGEVMKTVTQGTLPFSSVLKSSPLKPEVQREISMMLEHSLEADDNKHRKWLEEKTDFILKSSFNQSDKEILLTLMAIQYHLPEFSDMGRIRCNTSVNGNVVREGEGMDCAGAAAFIGFFIGYTVCGLYCGIGGAVVGFVAVVASTIS